MQAHLAGFDLGEVQDVVEQAQQRLRGPLGLAGVVALLRVQRGLVQQAQHAQDGVHGGADLVAHVGQELPLGRAGLLGDQLGLLQRGLVLQALGAVLNDAQVAADLALFGAHLGDHDRHRHPAAILADIVDLTHLAQPAGLDQHLHGRGVGVTQSQLRSQGLLASVDARRLVEAQGGGVAHDLAGAVAQQAFGPCVEHADHQVGIRGDHRGAGRRIEHIGQQGAGFAQLLLGQLAQRHVVADDDETLDTAIGIEEGGDHAVHPVQRAVLGAVADLTLPGAAGQHGVPQVRPEGAVMHPGVVDVVGLTDQLVPAVTTEGTEGVVDLDDAARAVSDRDDGVCIERAQQGIGFALRGLQASGRFLQVRDVLGDLDVAQQLALRVVARLDLGVDPEGLTILVAVEQFDATAFAPRQAGIELGQPVGGAGRGADERAHQLAFGLVKAVAVQAREALVDPADPHLGVGDHHRIGGATGHFGQTLQVGREAGRVRLRTGPRTGQHPGGQGQQGAQQGAAQHDPARGAAVQALLERGVGLGAQHILPSGDGQCALCGQSLAILTRLVAIGTEHLDRVSTGLVAQADVELLVAGVEQALHQVVDHDGGVVDAHQVGATLCHVQGRDRALVERQQVQHARALALILLEGDRPGQRGLPRVNGAQDPGPSHRLGTHVQPEGRLIASRRLEHLDHIQIGRVTLGADRERLRMVGPFDLLERAQHLAIDLDDVAKAPHAGELLVDVDRMDIVAKLRPVELFTGIVGAVGPAQAEQRHGKALADALLQAQ